ncbi:MAG: malonyl-CoA synthase [Actinomycetia bacterium]|nr:malonyl-CoA synthase [Actinomycetes bacterium]
MSNHLYDALLAPHAASERPCLHLIDGSTRTYSDMIELAACLASVLAAHGAEVGDRVVVQVDKSPEALALVFACLHAGLVLVPLNTAYTPAEVSYFVGDAMPAVLVSDPSRSNALVEIANGVGADLLTLGGDGSGSLMTEAAAAGDDHPVAEREAGDLAAILYTSGTTGRSKGAMLSHENLLSNTRSLAEVWRFSERDVLLHALPIFHTHGLFVAANVTLLSGGSMIFLPGFDADMVIRELPRATAIMGVPTFYTRLLARAEFDEELAGHMRLFVSGSAPLLAETHREFFDRTGHHILERYGMTETCMIASNPYKGERRPGTVGFALPGVELRIGEPATGKPVATGEIGVVELTGPNVFGGYWQMPEKTAEEFRDDGFFITGDLGQIDADGYLHIVGRGKDLIISGGFNVYPKEVETAIDDMDGIVESAVIGVPHPDFGEAVVAVVVPEPGAEIGEASIVATLGDSLARFKLPKRVLFTDELPRNTMGKVQKNILRDEHAGILEARQ